MADQPYQEWKPGQTMHVGEAVVPTEAQRQPINHLIDGLPPSVPRTLCGLDFTSTTPAIALPPGILQLSLAGRLEHAGILSNACQVCVVALVQANLPNPKDAEVQRLTESVRKLDDVVGGLAARLEPRTCHWCGQFLDMKAKAKGEPSCPNCLKNCPKVVGEGVNQCLELPVGFNAWLLDVIHCHAELITERVLKELGQRLGALEKASQATPAPDDSAVSFHVTVNGPVTTEQLEQLRKLWAAHRTQGGR